jgi:phosphate transport system substrate-binding protein
MEKLQLCISCFKEKLDKTLVCKNCGFDESKYIQNTMALKPKAFLNNRFIIGISLEQTELFIRYSAFDLNLKKRVIVEEFFPYQLVKRSDNSVELLNEKFRPYFKYGLTRFLNDSEKLSKIKISCLSELIHSFRENGTAYRVFEHLEGKPLKNILESSEKMGVNKALNVVNKIAEGLEELHKNGFYHLNLSEDTVFITHDDEVKLINFNTSLISIIRDKSVINKKPTDAPEIFNNKSIINQSTDIYSLCVITCYLLTGDYDVEAGDLTDSVKNVLRKGMNSDQNHRYQSVTDFKKAFNDAITPSALSYFIYNKSDNINSPLKKPKKRFKLAYAVMFLLFFVLFGGFFYLFNYTTENKLVAKHLDIERQLSTVMPTSPEIIFRIHGSNTIGAKLAYELAASYLKEKGADNVETLPLANVNEGIVQGYFNRENRLLGVEIFAHGSSTAFKDLLNGTTDIGAASRKIKKEEVELLKHLGDMESFNSEHVIGLDGLAIIVNRNNPVESLTIQQLKDIFSGIIVDWSEITRKHSGKINVYSRDDKSGTYDTFKELVLGRDKLVQDAKRYESNEALSDDVSRDIYAIGFCGLPYVKNSKALAISDGESQPILPTLFSIQTEDYPLSRRLYFYAPPFSKNLLSKEFIEFTLSKKGQKIVEKVGFINLEVTHIKVDTNSIKSDEYLSLAKNYLRLSISFRFKPDSYELDNRAMRDLERVLEFFKENKIKNFEVILLGFSDSLGNSEYNLTLSQERAEVVRNVLNKRGIVVSKVMGLGDKIPVASNSTASGRYKNRRVEIWVREL